MGVIRRQGIKYSAVTYAATVLGMVNVLFIYPAFFTPEELGLTRFLIDTAALFAPLILLGLNNVVIRFFPQFRDEEAGHRGFLSFVVLYAILAAGFASLLYFLFESPIRSYYSARSPLFEEYFSIIWILILLMAFAVLFSQYSLNFMRAAVPAFIEQWYLKISLPLLAVLYYYSYLSLDEVVWGIVITFCLKLISQMGYLRWLGQFRIKPFRKHIHNGMLRQMGVFALFGFFGAMGAKAINFLDAFMVGTLIGLDSLAVFAIAFFISNVLSVPMYSLQSISSPVVAEAWNNNDTDKISNLYHRTTHILLVIGLGIFILIWSQIDHIYTIMPNGDYYSAGKTVVLILGISKLIDLGTGINNIIIAYSEYFRVNFYLQLVLGILSVFMNLWLIPIYGIEGAAMATFTSLGLYNVIRLVFLYRKFGMLPYRASTAGLVLTGIVLIIAGPMLPGTGILLIDILWQSLLLGSTYVSLAWYFKWSEDFNSMVAQALNIARKILTGKFFSKKG